jgi:tRNA(Ile)-lysidine synthase
LRPDLTLLDQLRRTNEKRRLLPPGARVLVAVSGGADSLSLLHALHSLRSELSIDLVAAHLNHGMRGADAEADARFVREIGQAWGIRVEVERRDVPALARRTGLLLEEAGREARYRFFGRAARRTGCDTIATAHNADDRAENVLLHLFRGSGLEGLIGYPARRPLRPGRPTPVVVRPLIDVSRAAVLAHCEAVGLQPRHDATNDSRVYLRNRLRHELIPLLEAEYSPALRRQLLRLARLAEEENAYLDQQALELLQAAAAGMGPSATDPIALGRGKLVLERTLLTSAPTALSRRALRLAVAALQPGPAPELSTVDRLLALARGQQPGFQLPGGRWRARISERILTLEANDPARGFLEEEPVRLVIPGITPLPGSGGVIAGSLVPDPTNDAASRVRPHLLLPLPADVALLDRSKLTGELIVRLPRPGDRIQPLGMTGHRKLQDLFTDRKVSRAARRRVPVVCDDEKLVWVAGHCVSEAARVTPATTCAVRLEWEPADG